MKTYCLFIFYFFYSSVSIVRAQELYKNPNLSADERAKDLLSRMTLDEKISQTLNNSAAIPRLGVPAVNWWNEALHGVARAGKATVFPMPIGLAATFDVEGVHKMFSMVSDEARAKHHNFKKNNQRGIYQGLTFWTPNINIFRDPRWGRGMETYGEDPFLTSQMGMAVVRGLQGDGKGKYDKTHACAKHYAVHSGPEWNRHKFDANNISERNLRETYLPAFKALVTEAGVREVMCAYNRFDGVPCCSNKELLVDILRNEWKYDNVVVSDCGAVDDFYWGDGHHTHPSAVEASADAMVTGTDLTCGNTYKSLGDAVKRGLITEQQINQSVYRLLRARFQLGMFDPDSMVPWSKIPYSVVESKEHVSQSLEMARESIVLLKNKNNILPLKKTMRIAVVGPNANDSIMLWGNYNGIPTKSVTILEGLRTKVAPANIIYEKGCDYVSDSISTGGGKRKVDFDVVVNKVKAADVIVFVGGISPALEGEEMNVDLPGFRKGDRTRIELPEIQQQVLKSLKATGKPVVFILCSGSSVALPWESANLDAILEAWYPGQQGGKAVADVLFGDYNPAGRLPLTFYGSTNDLPDFEDYDMTKGRTYRYFKGNAVYPFGYGLSYTKFAYGEAVLNRRNISLTGSASLTVKVRNTGKRGGDEVVQVYIINRQDPSGPIKSLRGYKRVHISAGKSVPVKVDLANSAFAFFNPKSGKVEVMPGKYDILYGGSSDGNDLKKVSITIQ
jgi:beta-glucosidase